MTRRRFAPKAYAARLLEFGGRCAECGAKTGGANGMHWDHIIPLKLGGADALGNLQPLCKACHNAKTRDDVGHIAKSKRMQQRSAGIKKTRRPLPGSRNSGWKKTFSDGWVKR